MEIPPVIQEWMVRCLVLLVFCIVARLWWKET